MAEPKNINDLKGYVATISLTGSVTPQFSSCLAEMRSHNERNGLINVEYKINHGVHVEAARDSVVQHALNPRGDKSQPAYDWILQIDADATFPAWTLQRLLEQAYVMVPESGVIGAYAQLKQPPNLPTIDTGTGTWEEHYPGEGLLKVIRTGCHCFLAKTWIFGRVGNAPWFRTRSAPTPLRAFREVDGFARRTLSGNNPLADHPEWETLMAQAGNQPPVESHVGEDSSFFDRCLASGIQVFVDCDLVTGHVAQQVIMPPDLKRCMDEQRKTFRLALGING